MKLGNKTKGYWCKEGYIRTCGNTYDNKDYHNNFTHLTNDAIQHKAHNYGRFEEGNKLSFKDLQRYLDHEHPRLSFSKNLYPKLKEMACDVIKASWRSIGQGNTAPVF